MKKTRTEFCFFHVVRKLVIIYGMMLLSMEKFLIRRDSGSNLLQGVVREDVVAKYLWHTERKGLWVMCGPKIKKYLKYLKALFIPSERGEWIERIRKNITTLSYEKAKKEFITSKNENILRFLLWFLNCLAQKDFWNRITSVPSCLLKFLAIATVTW